MVFQDISNSFELNNSDKTKSAAHMGDRFFSFLIDYMVISPFVFFLLYLTYSNGFNFWKSHPAAPENDLFVLILLFSYVVYFSLIQSVFIVVWRATPGQYFLKIKMDFNESNSLIFFRSFFRQVAFWGSFLLLGIPFISVMTNKSRRTFYDRVGDVSVVSKKNEMDFFTFEKEHRYWRSFMATLFLFVGFLISVVIWNNYTAIVQRNASFAELRDKRFFCVELQNVSLDERLQTAVALNLVNQLSDDCLDKEADFVLWKQKISDYSLAYYAKSLTAQDAGREAAYLRQSCDGQQTEDHASLSLGCKISYSFLNNKIEQLYVELTEESFLNDALKYELSVILEKPEEIKNNFSKIEKYNSLRSIKKYQVLEMLSQNVKTVSARQPAAVQDVNETDSDDKILNLIGEL